MKIKKFVIAFLAAVLLYACDKTGEDTPEPSIRPLSSNEAEVVNSSNNFSMELLSKVNGDHHRENVFISPFSITTALSMALNGADGETKNAIKETLGLQEMTDENINQTYQQLVNYLYRLDSRVTLNVANSTWYSDELTIKEEFEEILSYYDAQVSGANFDDAATLELINTWIENETRGKIKDMLQEIPAETVMFLINAIYFKAQWTTQFEKSKTNDQPFTLMNGSTLTVPTMYAEDAMFWLSYDANRRVQLIDIPYGNEVYSFTIVMPDDPTKINDLAQSFTLSDLELMAQDTVRRSMELFMPKFKIEFKQLLNNYLFDMGMAVAFSDNADFSNLFDENIPLSISQVLHQSFLEVNEEGSEAAAATIIGIDVTSVPPKMRVDKPFLFFIRERNSNTILFSGKLINPAI